MAGLSHSQKDALLIVTKALPAQNTTNTSDSIDLGLGIPEHVQALIELPATPSLADGQTITLTLHDSADNSSFAAVAALASLAVTGAGGVGAAATSRQVALPPGIRRYIRLSQAASATAGNNTAVSATLSVLV